MANHKAELVKVEKVGNGAVVFHAHCCGDRQTETRHTLYLHAAITDEQVEQAVQEHLTRTAALHAAHDRVAAVLEKYQGKGESNVKE